MKGIGQWKQLLGGSKKTVPVRMGGTVESMTVTQAHRFDELSHRQQNAASRSDSNPFEGKRYSISDAAFRLMTSESRILDLAASGSIALFADVGGLSGRWMREDDSHGVLYSPAMTLDAGYLAIPSAECTELISRGQVEASVFELPRLTDPGATGLDPDVLAVTSTWPECRAFFESSAPRRVTIGSVVLLPPLALPDEIT